MFFSVRTSQVARYAICLVLIVASMSLFDDDMLSANANEGVWDRYLLTALNEDGMLGVPSLLEQNMDAVQTISPSIADALDSDGWLLMDPLEKYRLVGPELLSYWGSVDQYKSWNDVAEFEVRIEHMRLEDKRRFVSVLNSNIDFLLHTAVMAELIRRYDDQAYEIIASSISSEFPTELKSLKECTDIATQEQRSCFIESEVLMQKSLATCIGQLEGPHDKMDSTANGSEFCRDESRTNFKDYALKCVTSLPREISHCQERLIQELE